MLKNQSQCQVKHGLILLLLCIQEAQKQYKDVLSKQFNKNQKIQMIKLNLIKMAKNRMKYLNKEVAIYTLKSP
jgi:hypothetical protein